MEDVHDVVKLLVARMESNPEEFVDINGRWYAPLADIAEFGSEGDRAAIHACVRNIRLSAAHEFALDELINGEERRAAEKRAIEAERAAYGQQAYALQAAYAQQAQAQTRAHYTNQYSGPGNGCGGGGSPLTGSVTKNSYLSNALGKLGL